MLLSAKNKTMNIVAAGEVMKPRGLSLAHTQLHSAAFLSSLDGQVVQERTTSCCSCGTVPGDTCRVGTCYLGWVSWHDISLPDVS